MTLNFFILFFYSVGSDIQVSDFLSWVDSGGTELTWNSSLSARWELLEKRLSFLSALSAVFLWNLVPSLSLTWWNIRAIHVAQTQRDKDYMGWDLAKEQLLGILHSVLLLWAFKTKTQNHNTRVVWGPDPTSFLDGLCKEVVILLF